MTGPELVYDLHVRRGMKLPKVARVLGVGVKVVREFWRQHLAPRAAPSPPPKSREELLAGAPRSEGDYTALRERVCLELWETVVATFSVPEMAMEAEGEGDEAGVPVAKSPMLAVRMRALKQMGKLYGLDGKRPDTEAEEAPGGCAKPEEIVEMVREWRRSRGRGVDVRPSQ